MAEVVQFRSARALAEQEQVFDQALPLIEALGAEAGYRIGCMARSPALDDSSRARLLSIAKEIDRQQGFGWHFDEAGGAEAER